ncbi:hypothetical protein OWP19_23810 [Bacillus cereus]|nr:hypothetical protein [Bacillus cereus]MDK7480997.1 hypothetical protein [Bacillus cereus]
MENERVARLEASIEKIEKGLDATMEKQEKGFGLLAEKLDAISDRIERRYLPRTEHEQVVKRLDERIDEVEKENEEMRVKAARNFNLAVTSAVGLAGTLLTILFK